MEMTLIYRYTRFQFRLCQIAIPNITLAGFIPTASRKPGEMREGKIMEFSLYRKVGFWDTFVSVTTEAMPE